ncbi:hypothetical protein SLS58_009234 [Diplodia intermedia]|uniref:Tyrosinase copper-binding domain-containing protein n=1 Tax=Diplodia intermedia TaxID=856260 RepID=A0ABR3TDY0_9PEZI
MLIPTLVLTFATLTASAVYPSSYCTQPVTRIEWRQLSDGDRRSYVAAVRCLRTRESVLGLNTSLYDDFPYVHNALNKRIHLVAAFLPWHRYFVHLYERALQSCGYNGSATYWDWAWDSIDPMDRAPMWDAKTGFGGSGSQQNRSLCVVDGPFKDFRPAYLRNNLHPHCLARNFNNGTDFPGDMSAPKYSPAVVDKIQALGNYNTYRLAMEGGPHFSIHRAIGGDMIPATSPNDPIFFLHHGQIDRLWYQWQQKDPVKRHKEYSGIRTQNQFDGTTPPQANLNDILPMFGLAADLPVSKFLTTQNDVMCYKY